jgi:hypothetical protein
MPLFDKTFKAMLGTDTTVNRRQSIAIWVRAVQRHDGALIHISQPPNDVYLTPDAVRDYAAYLVSLADKITDTTRIESVGDTGVVGFVDVPSSKDDS